MTIDPETWVCGETRERDHFIGPRVYSNRLSRIGNPIPNYFGRGRHLGNKGRVQGVTKTGDRFGDGTVSNVDGSSPSKGLTTSVICVDVTGYVIGVRRTPLIKESTCSV